MADDLLILVPGIMGSVLQKKKKDVWQISLGAIWRAVVGGRDLSNIRLNEASIDHPTADDVEASGLLQDIQIIPGLVSVDGYSAIAEQLAKKLSIKSDRYYEFAYDWRRDNRGTAKRLGEYVDARLKALPADSKCVLVCHSMGGLVARYWLEVLGGWKRCRALVTIATPHRGSVDAVGFLCNGMSKKLGPLKLFDLTETLRSFTSIYQLLPIYPCVDPGDGRLVRVTEAAALPNLDLDRARDAIAFHREIEAAVDANLADPAYRKHAPIVCPIVGTNQKTTQSVRLGAGEVSLLASHGGIDMDGDGTVPRVSATPIELSDDHREIFAAGRHSSLQNMSAVIEQVRGVITGADLHLAQFRSGGRGVAQAKLSLEMDEVFVADEHLVVRVQPTREPVNLTVTVRTASGGQLVQQRLRRDGSGAHVATLDPLPDGMYRVEVGGTGAATISDVFAVVGGTEERHARRPVRWSSSFGVIPASAPVQAAQQLLSSGLEYLVIERPQYGYAFAREEVEALTDPSLDLLAALKLHEHEASHEASGFKADAPAPAQLGALPSSGRLIARDAAGKPVAIGAATSAPQPKTRGSLRGPTGWQPAAISAVPGPIDVVDESVVQRYPKLEASPAKRASPITIIADLALLPTVAGAAAAIFQPPRAWGSFDVAVALSCEQIAFDNDGRGIISVRRGKPSDPAELTGMVKDTVRPGQILEVRASFLHENRAAGSIALSIAVDAEDGSAPPAILPGQPLEPLALDRETVGPDLTVEIIATGPGRFLWSLHVSKHLLANAALTLPPSLRGSCDLGGDPASFVGGALQKNEQTPRGQHGRWLEGFGEQLYKLAPACFQQTYAELRRTFPTLAFTIQFISDDPHIPWELMYVPEGRSSRQLSAEHPVARWLGGYSGWLRNRLRKGTIAAIAPRYASAEALPYAAKEAALLKSKFGAVLLTPAGRDELFALLEGDGAGIGLKSLAEIAVVHYAGHGEFAAGAVQRSALILENDGRVEIPEVNRSRVTLGEDTRALVFLNACQVGMTGAVLASVGGWAEALIARRFSAVIAPLWAVHDVDALSVTTEFYSMAIEHKLTVAEALRRIRKQFGRQSQTYQSYLLFGDVMARFA